MDISIINIKNKPVNELWKRIKNTAVKDAIGGYGFKSLIDIRYKYTNAQYKYVMNKKR